MADEEAKKLEKEATEAAKAEEEKLKKELLKKIAKEKKAFKKQLRKLRNKFIPKWLFGKGKEPGGIQCLYDKKYREGTWMCICLGTFNIMTGVTVMLVYMKEIFQEANHGS
jgi:hypothetical protein